MALDPVVAGYNPTMPTRPTAKDAADMLSVNPGFSRQNTGSLRQSNFPVGAGESVEMVEVPVHAHPAVQWDELSPHNKQAILDAVVEREKLVTRQHELGILPKESNIPVPPPEELVRAETCMHAHIRAHKHPAAWWPTDSSAAYMQPCITPPLSSLPQRLLWLFADSPVYRAVYADSPVRRGSIRRLTALREPKLHPCSLFWSIQFSARPTTPHRSTYARTSVVVPHPAV